MGLFTTAAQWLDAISLSVSFDHIVAFVEAHSSLVKDPWDPPSDAPRRWS